MKVEIVEEVTREYDPDDIMPSEQFARFVQVATADGRKLLFSRRPGSTKLGVATKPRTVRVVGEGEVPDDLEKMLEQLSAIEPDRRKVAAALAGTTTLPENASEILERVRALEDAQKRVYQEVDRILLAFRKVSPSY